MYTIDIDFSNLSIEKQPEEIDAETAKLEKVILLYLLNSFNLSLIKINKNNNIVLQKRKQKDLVRKAYKQQIQNLGKLRKKR